MSLALYDKALIEKFKLWMQNTDTHIFSPDETERLYEVLEDINGDSGIKLPFLSLTRSNGYIIKVPNKEPLSYDGYTPDATFEKSIQINAVPISIQYQLDVYTRYFIEADEYIRNLIFNLINFPKAQILLPYKDLNIKSDFSIQLMDSVIDNSNIQERLIPAQFTRLSLQFEIPDAYLWDLRTRDNIHIDMIHIDLN